MPNKPGPQPDVKYCLAFKGNLENVPRNKMKSHPVCATLKTLAYAIVDVK
jgi:hypothetical protein